MQVIPISALNVVIVGLMMIIFTFIWRQIASMLSERGSNFGDAMATIL